MARRSRVVILISTETPGSSGLPPGWIELRSGGAKLALPPNFQGVDCGAEVTSMGDGFMASFGSVTSAVERAVTPERAFAAHTESKPEPLHVRVGLNTGEPIEENGDLFGATVILASRIAAKAGAGEILIPEPVSTCWRVRLTSTVTPG